MPRVLSDLRLIHFSKAQKTERDIWRQGVSIVADSNTSIDALTLLVAIDRWKLGNEHHRHARKLHRIANPVYRCIISRYYYAMYHVMRSCAYIFHDGDDFQEHSKLPVNVPVDMPNRPQFQDKLKDARLLRNRADYDPYPSTNQAWRLSAEILSADAQLFVTECKLYLQGKGCAL